MKNHDTLKRMLFYEQQIVHVTNRSVQEYYRKKFNSLLKEIERYSVKYDYESPQDIINLMVKEFGYPKDYATSRRRYRDDYVFPRHMTMKICRHIFKHKSLTYIGQFFSNGDHATILHALKTVSNLCDTDKEYATRFNKIQKYFLGNIEI